MAIIKIKPIKNNLKRAIDYIVDDKKTDYGINTYTDTLAVEYAAKEYQNIKENWEDSGKAKSNKEVPILAYHIVQSFDVKEKLEAEEVLELGKEFAKRYFNGNYKVVIATHNDKKHIHNHIIVNAYSHNGMSKYYSIPYKTIDEFRKLNDEICKENGLTVIEKEEGKKAKSIDEIYANKRGKSYKTLLQKEIDYNVKLANNYEEFLILMKEKYEVKENRKYISFRRKDSQERFTRAKTLGEEYTEERIKERIVSENIEKPKFVVRNSSKYEKLCKSMNDLRKYEKALAVINKENIKSSVQLEEKIKINELEKEEKLFEIKKNEKKIELMSEIVEKCRTYRENEDIYVKYKKTMSKEIYENNKREITLADTSKKFMESYNIDTKVDVKELEKKLEEMKELNIKLRKETQEKEERITDLNKSVKIMKQAEELNKKDKER